MITDRITLINQLANWALKHPPGDSNTIHAKTTALLRIRETCEEILSHTKCQAHTCTHTEDRKDHKK